MREFLRSSWRQYLVALAATGAFLAFDALLVISCSLKFADGGWFPLVLGAAIFALMATWKRGRALLHEQSRRDGLERPAYYLCSTRARPSPGC